MLIKEQTSNEVLAIDNEDIEFQLLLEAIFKKYGYDFRDYSFMSLKRQVIKRMESQNYTSISQLQEKVLRDESLFRQLLLDFSINVTEFFRDPEVYKVIRSKVVPILKTYPSIKIWHAGSATGQEVYSMAIILKEEGLYDRTQIYATDINKEALSFAKEGIYTLTHLNDEINNYFQSGGKETLTDYFSSDYGFSIINKELKKNILFSDHNLVSDGSIGEMNMIFCRNVFIYFSETLRKRALNIFNQSLCRGGFLCLGARERLFPKVHDHAFREFLPKEKIYIKKGTIQ